MGSRPRSSAWSSGAVPGTAPSAHRGLHGVTLVDLEAARQRIADRGPNETVLGNGHPSYRGLRLPWAQHWFEYSIVAAVLFLLVSVVYLSRTRQGNWRSQAV